MKTENAQEQKYTEQILAVNNSLREQSLEWFFAKSEIDKRNLKNKYFPSTPIPHSSQWGFHFTFGQIQEMYTKEK